MIYTTSLFPSAPSPIPGPGIINWSMYIIPSGRLPSGDDDGNTTAISDWQFVGTEEPPMKNVKSLGLMNLTIRGCY